MLKGTNILKKMHAILVILPILLCFNIGIALNAHAADPTVTAAVNWWSKMEAQVKPIKSDINKTYTNINKEYQKLVSEKGRRATRKNPCQTGFIDIIYGGGCHSCKVIKILMSTFINGCSVLEDVSKSAGTTILLFCFMLWIAFFVLQQLGSLKNIEPMDMVNKLLVMFFKVMCTYLVIQAGFDLLLNYLIVPVLQWGVDFGSIMLDAAVENIGLNNTGVTVEQVEIMPDDENFLPGSLLNGMMDYLAKMNATITNHMKMGHMIACHARHKGRITFMAFFHITDFATLLCGILIWIFGFIMAFAVVFYLFDAALKLAVALVLLPILIAFWPFQALRDKSMACVKMITNTAALFVFLSLTVSMGLVLVDKAVQIGDTIRQEKPEESIMEPEANDVGMKALMAEIDDGNSQAVKDRFSLSSVAFALLIFTYLYAIKLIRSTIDDYVNKFFADELTGKIQELNRRVTGLAGIAGQRAKQITKGVVGGVAGKAKQSLHKAGHKVIDKIRPKGLDQYKGG